MRRGQLHALTSLRFFAAASIVFFHLTGTGFLPFKPNPALANGVSFFFVLSGFILAYNYDGSGVSPGRFYLARFARIWPVHIATIMVLFFFLPQIGVWATDSSGSHIFWTNLFLLQAWVPSGAYVISFNGVSWSISVEMFFYAVFPLVLACRRIWLLAAIIGVITIAVPVGADLSGAVATKADPWAFSWQHIVMHFPPMRLFEFVIGVATARLFGNIKHAWAAKDTTALEVASIIGVVAGVEIMNELRGFGITGIWLGQSGAFAFFAALILVFALGRGAITRFLSLPIMVRLGEISFATYMTHQIILRHAINSKMPAMWTGYVPAFVVIAASYLTSFVIWKMVEVPARNLILRTPAALQALAARRAALFGPAE